MAQTQDGQRSLHMPLLVLAFVTGLVDATTYLSFGHVFAANMTGNVMVLGFALAGVGEISATSSLVSFSSFMVGGIISARVARSLQRTRQLWILTMLVVETVLLSVAAVLSVGPLGSGVSYTIVGLLAVAMGMRTVTIRQLGISNVSTTVLTTMLAALATDTQLPGATTLYATGPPCRGTISRRLHESPPSSCLSIAFARECPGLPSTHGTLAPCSRSAVGWTASRSPSSCGGTVRPYGAERSGCTT